MNTKSRLPVTLAIAAAVVASSLSGAALAQPNSDVYANPGTQPASRFAEAPANVTRAPVPGIVVAYTQFGPSAAGASTDRPIVVAAPFQGRGHVESAGGALSYTGLVAGN